MSAVDQGLARPALLAAGVGAVTGALVGLGGPVALLPAAAVALLVGLLLQRSRPGLLPVLALAVAATPPLLALPLSVTVGGKSLYLSDLLLPAAAVVALTRRSRLQRTDLLVLAYAAVIAFDSAVGIVRHQPFQAFTQDLRGPAYIVLGYVIASRLWRPVHSRAAVRAALVVLWYSAGLMLVTIVTGTELLAGRVANVRVQGVGGTAAELDATRFIVNSKVLAFVVLVAAATVLLSRRAGARERLLAAVLALPAFLVTFLGYARATLLALLLCTAVLLVLRRRADLHGGRLGAVVLAAAALVGVVGLTGTASLLSDPDGNLVARQVAGFEERVLGGLTTEQVETPGNEYRLLENRYALMTWGENPLFGQGIGASYHPPMIADPLLQAFETDPEFGSRFVHNGYLWYLVKTGLVGLLAFLAMVLVPVARVLRRAAGPEGMPPVDVALAVSLLGLMLIHAFEPDMHRVGGAALVGALIGYLSLRGASRAPIERGPSARSRGTRTLDRRVAP
ncbi:O-antigen ligase family protein [Vallicoccus soli]|uniref:O-antigen ligase-related domain-containing protein n=1 Tax=Vallicoccus soli TaxID=2339232 RepID=A0A3A3Z0V0_9ACTN|nr:O-antigen ligase family protein [Vallicoccus soli]RJK97879.1 hypothetical protein D5H78_02600 [Vallicoccus soli]